MAQRWHAGVIDGGRLEGSQICHQWSNPKWTDWPCRMIRQTGPDRYEFTKAADAPGRKFSVVH